MGEGEGGEEKALSLFRFHLSPRNAQYSGYAASIVEKLNLSTV